SRGAVFPVIQRRELRADVDAARRAAAANNYPSYRRFGATAATDRGQAVTAECRFRLVLRWSGPAPQALTRPRSGSGRAGEPDRRTVGARRFLARSARRVDVRPRPREPMTRRAHLSGIQSRRAKARGLAAAGAPRGDGSRRRTDTCRATRPSATTASSATA